MKNNVVYMSDFADLIPNEEENENLRHYEDGEKCICWDCEDARRHPKEPDWKSLPLFVDYAR